MSWHLVSQQGWGHTSHASSGLTHAPAFSSPRESQVFGTHDAGNQQPLNISVSPVAGSLLTSSVRRGNGSQTTGRTAASASSGSFLTASRRAARPARGRSGRAWAALGNDRGDLQGTTFRGDLQGDLQGRPSERATRLAKLGRKTSGAQRRAVSE